MFRCRVNHVRISSALGLAFSARRALALMIIPGVQNPHCIAPSSMNEA
jgi:hypothetical protein